MMFTELFVPKGTHSTEELGRIAQRLTAHTLLDEAEPSNGSSAERADPGVLNFLESITHVVVHEVEVWIAGGKRQDAAQPPRYVVRVYVPGPWRKPLSEHLITQITAALPGSEVHVLGVPEGGYGAFGRVVGESVLTDMISDAVSGTAEVPDGMVVDPVCGAVLALDRPGVVTMEVDGTMYGFCCAGCRQTFSRRAAGA